MQKNKSNLLIYGIHLLNPYKTVVSHLKFNSSILGKFWTSGLMLVGLLNCSLDMKSTIIRESEEILIVVIVVSKL